LPALTSGVLTFGCLNNPNKVSQSVLAVWTQILKNIPSSRLLLYGRAASHMHKVSADFAQAGIDPSRIEFVASQPYREYLQTYHRIDIALDPFPYVGGITSCDSLWMGVPFITLAGTQMAVSRGGVSILSNVGLHELIARNPHEYISKVTDLANDLPRLSDLRKNLRSQMQRSPLLDAPRFARSIESAYRQMWRKWPDASPMLK
jgi:predicted O-linked N-acetylglucosamine transferase (SPINDLY family)